MSESSLTEFTYILQSGGDLTSSHIKIAAEALVTPGVNSLEKEVFLEAFAKKGETADELSAFAREFRERAIDPGMSRFADRAIDVCGTGGDHSGSFNVSTAVAFFLAAAGVPVFKHGNRSITSRSGSADLLEVLGLPLQMKPEAAREVMERTQFTFFFAPAFHPAFKEIVPVRKSLAARGVRTIFNSLGPLLNPGRPAYQLLGVFAVDRVALMAGALEGLGLQAFSTVHGQIAEDSGMDELSVCAANYFAGACPPGVSLPFRAGDVGLAEAPVDSLQGGAAEENLKILKSLLNEDAPDGLRDTVLLNTAWALWLAGAEPDLGAGLERGRQLLRDRVVYRWLDHLLSISKSFS